jgi:voltage-dependent potassium channel beta subunit
MDYRRVGPTGLKVSVLGFGSWVTFGGQLDQGLAERCLAAAFEGGVNFFDNAESYASGESERLMGKAIASLGWQREDYVISTKYFWGIRDNVNMRNTLNRKYLLSAIDPSLERLGLDFVDLVYCHRADPGTPLVETVWAMHDIVASGRALYWGTSEWSADQIREAVELAERHHLHRPVVEQPQYNVVVRDKVETEFAGLYESPGLGLTTWSPLASGLLSGKYLQGVPAGSRAALPGYEWLRPGAEDPENRRKVANMVAIAGQLGCTPAQLAIAWCVRNPRVSSVITGASNADQVRENLAALDVVARIDDEVAARIDEAVR